MERISPATHEELVEMYSKMPVAVIDFSAEWCGPCKALHPQLEALAKKHGDVKFLNIDVDQCGEIAEYLNVQAMPTIKIVKAGNIVDTIVGANIELINGPVTCVFKWDSCLRQIAITLIGEIRGAHRKNGVCMGKNTRMQQWINYRIRVTVDDSRMFVGTFMAFDRHMNVVLADAEEFRRMKAKGNQGEKEVKRAIGFVLIRGESLISITAEAPPAPEPRRTETSARPTIPHAMGRGAPMLPVLGGAPLGLEGPVRGVAGMPQF